MLRANERAGRYAFLGYDVGATWRSRVGFNHRNMKQIGYAAGARLCVEAHVVSDTFWADLLRARADFAARACVHRHDGAVRRTPPDAAAARHEA